MRFAIPFALLVLSLLPSPADAGLLDPKGPPIDEFTIDLSGRWWFGKLAAEATADSDFIPGTDIDLPDTLDLQKPIDPLIEGVAHLRLWKVQIRAAYTQAHFEEDLRLEETINFRGHSFTVGDDINAEAWVRFAGLDINALVVDTGSAKTIGLEIGTGIGARYLSFSGTIKENLGGLSAGLSRHGIVPVISAFASVGFANIFRIDLEAAGMKIPSSILRVEGTFLDLTAEARLYLHRFVFINAGYRFVMLRAEWQRGPDISFDGRLQGFFIGLGVAF